MDFGNINNKISFLSALITNKLLILQVLISNSISSSLLAGSEWITKENLEAKLSEKVSDQEVRKLIIKML